MLFSPQLPLTTLIDLSRALRHGLHAGLPLARVFRQQARSGPRPLRPVAERIGDQLEAGTSLEECLEAERTAFPPLFRSLAGVAEQTGRMPEVFGEIEKYYRMQLTLRRQFVSQITWPVFELIAAIGVIAGLIFILGLVAESTNSKPLEPIGMGLTGTSGAIKFLVGVVGIFALGVGVYAAAVTFGRQKPAIDAFLLRLPALGPTLEALALMRFCLGLHMTLEAGLRVPAALRRSLAATGNAAFEARADAMAAVVRGGGDIVTALEVGGLFPEDFRQVMAVAEESGQVPEVMAKQAENYQEIASHRLTILTRVASFGVWALVAIFIIVAIFRIGSIYFGAINQLAG